MKKILLLVSILFLLTGCGNNSTQNNTENNSTSSGSNNGSGAALSDTIAYSGTLNVSGVGPDVSLEATISSDTLALKYTNLEQSYTDHLFIDAFLWQGLIQKEDLTLPGNKVLFEGKVIGLEGAAGNHYYQVVEINKLEKTANPTKEEIQSLVKSYGYCEKDSDCSWFYGECPFGCLQAVNTKFLDISQNVIKNWYNSQENNCEYGECTMPQEVKCENNKCVAK